MPVAIHSSAPFKKFTFFSIIFLLLILLSISLPAYSQTTGVAAYNLGWNSQSKSAAESMPCGGGDIGLNVWVEKGEVFCYLSRSGAFDENNMFLKLGRVRLKLSPNPFEGEEKFEQRLNLPEGHVEITGKKGKQVATVIFWVDVFRPVVHVEIRSKQATTCQVAYESWRTQDRSLTGSEDLASSYKRAPFPLTSYQDAIDFKNAGVLFYHRNRATPSVFDFTVNQQGMESVKAQLWNPLKELTFGGYLQGRQLAPAGVTRGKYVDTNFTAWQLQSTAPERSHQVQILLHVAQTTTPEEWLSGLNKLRKEAQATEKTARQKTRRWWQQFWERSFIYINSDKRDSSPLPWQVGRNYQLFRYMLGCNAYGAYPTKFNGGLFTYDPGLEDPKYPYTPDHRNWGGGTFTAQNQRLVYWPMLKSGDFDMMPAQFDFYQRALPNAELRSQVYWGHAGACFTEQVENFGLPQAGEYGWQRSPNLDPGLEHNPWLEYLWDTHLEFCLMILDLERFTGKSIREYLPFIESSLTFFDEHYQYLARKRGAKPLDGNGHLILYPGSGAETYKMAYNATSTIAGLQTVLTRLLELSEAYLPQPKRSHWATMQQRLPPISFRMMQGHRTIAPAALWERINNQEIPQLYPVFPYGQFGVGKPDLAVAVDTWKYDTEASKMKGFIGWKQDGIFCARLGLTAEAATIALQKMQDSGRRFPAFWGPGFDWVPDHNWGGAGMIGLQEMLLQTDGKRMMLFPAWPKYWDVHFKLHAPYQTTVEVALKNGQVSFVKVLPESRKKDVEILLK